MKNIATASVLRVESTKAQFISRLLAYAFAMAAAIFLASVFASSAASAQTSPASTPTSSLIVKLAAGLSADEQAAVVARNGGVEIASVPALRLHTIQVDTDQLDAIAANYRADPQVLRVELNNVRQSNAIPSDPFYSQQWALRRSAGTSCSKQQSRWNGRGRRSRYRHRCAHPISRQTLSRAPRS
jgi:hypothetical protein